MENKKHGFGSALGFILAAAGSAVGLGNLWAFPYKVSQNGGAAFVLVYIACVVLIGCIVMMAEIYLGKRGKANTISAYKKVNKNLGFFGVIAIIIPTVIVCYYCVLGGWTLRYAVNSFQPNDALSNANSFASFTSNPIMPIVFTFIFMAITAVIIMGGIKNGIERASKFLMPILFLIVVFIAIFSLFLGDGVKDGLNFYLNPDFKELGFEGVLAAMGQAFFSLSIGMGTLISYGSYTGKVIKVGKSTFMICLFDSLVALLAGLAIFSSLGALQPDSLQSAHGVGLVYQILPQVFEKMGAIGPFISLLFFIMVVIAALTSVISILEVSVQFICQRYKKKRKPVTIIMAAICFLISIPITWSVGGAFDGKIVIFGYDLLTFLDEIANTVLMPVCAMGACIAIGWFIDKKVNFNPMKTLRSLEKDGLQLGFFGKIFAVMVKYVAPLVIGVVVVMGIIGKYSEYMLKGLNYSFVVGGALILIAVAIIVYFMFFENKDTGDNHTEELVENK